MMSNYARNSVLPMQKLLNRQTRPKRRENRKPAVTRPNGNDAGSWKTPTFPQPLKNNKKGGTSSGPRVAASRVGPAAHGQAFPSQPPRSVTFEDTNELSQLTLSQDLDSLPSSSIYDNKQTTLRLGQDSLSTSSREDGTVASRSHAPTVVSTSSRPSRGGQSISSTSNSSSAKHKLLQMMVTPHPRRRMTRSATAAASVAPSAREERQQAIRQRRSGSSLDGTRSGHSTQVSGSTLSNVRDPSSIQLERTVASLQEHERKAVQTVQEEQRRACTKVGEHVQEQELKTIKIIQDQEEKACNNLREQERLALSGLDDYNQRICKSLRELDSKEKALRKCLDAATEQHTVRERELDTKASKVSSLIDAAMTAHSKVTRAADAALATIANARDDIVASAFPYLVDPVTKFVRSLINPDSPVSVSESSSIEPSPLKSPPQESTDTTSAQSDSKLSTGKRKKIDAVSQKAKPLKRQRLLYEPAPTSVSGSSSVELSPLKSPRHESTSTTSAQSVYKKQSTGKPKKITTVSQKSKPLKRQRVALEKTTTTSSRKAVKSRTTNKQVKSPLQPLTMVDTNSEVFATRERQASVTKHAHSSMSLASCVTPCIPRDDFVDSPVSPIPSKKRVGVVPRHNRGRRRAFGANRPRKTDVSSDFGFLSSE